MTTSTGQKIFLKSLGIYQILGGGLGLYRISISSLETIIYVFGAIVFAFSIYVGIQTWRLKTNAITLTTINQYLQVLSINMFGLLYNYLSGLGFCLWLDLGVGNIDIGFEASIAQIYYVHHLNHYSLSINFIPIALLYFLYKIKNN
jgi:hypothetical protein